MEKKESHMPVVFRDETFDYHLMRTMGYSVFQMADINECLETARRIQDGSFESWHEQWYSTANRVQDIAEKSLKGGHIVSAREAFLRASNYYRTAEFFLHGDQKDPRIKETASKSCLCFEKSVSLMSQSVSKVNIPYEKTNLPGYFYRVDDKKRPTIIVQAGFDGTQEELYGYGLEGVKRGYNIFTFDGPGQGAALREQGLPFRPDWEVVIRAVVDFLVKQPEIDTNIIILYGLSFGGYLAPRGASGDNRIRILIANSGIYDYLEGIANSEGMSKDQCIQNVRKDVIVFDKTMVSIMNKSTNLRWAMEHGMFSFKVQTPSQLTEEYYNYTLKDRAHLIKSLTLICESEHELNIFKGQAQKLYDKLTCPKEFINFTQNEGAGLHCQMGALLLSQQRIFDWLDKKILDFIKKN
jgi:pimeloyl-ACP methyl ester carboxylesterase